MIIVVSLVTVLAAGVALLLYTDRREQRRIQQNGGRRF